MSVLGKTQGCVEEALTGLNVQRIGFSLWTKPGSLWAETSRFTNRGHVNLGHLDTCWGEAGICGPASPLAWAGPACSLVRPLC